MCNEQSGRQPNLHFNSCDFRPDIRVGAYPTSFPGLSLLLRERTLVAAGHVEMCVNKMHSRRRSSNTFCRLDDEISSGVGKKSLLQNGALVSELRANSLSASYYKIILKAKQVTKKKQKSIYDLVY